ncbi:GGDEF domain-containing protein [Microvirga antarctica]|uniref:GGDEF domain-containing protein n=1 Tax=Microvirga antarctica TaxID=2819233 RepID=UPI001B30C2E9|nr:diguanylate cyclase [Microvirga antarctica]
MRQFFKTLAKPRILTRRDLIRYVVLVTGVSLVVALAIDVANQLMFFTQWATAIRSWGLTIFVVVIIAVPASVIFGRAQQELQHSKRTLEVLSRTDPLTGLANRRALMEASEASSTQTMVLVIADVDRFKIVNDTYGHRIGDTVLQTIGRITANHLDQYGLVGRLGGEEFALISSTASVEEIVVALDELLRVIEKTPILMPGVAVRVTMSVGVAVRYAADTFERLYSEADEALYVAKRGGRNRIELSTRAQAAYPHWGPPSATG